MAEQTLNIPQVLVFVVIIFLSLRWYYSKPSNGSAAPGQNHGFRVNPAQVDQIAQMFPQLERRAIMWDLQRNRGNMSATTERVLSGRGLETPPPSFQPPLPRSAPPSRTATPAAKPSHPDLITRYNLTSKLSSTTEASSAESETTKKVWSQDKTERQRNLQRRREEMILAARRKLEEKERVKSTGAAS